MGSNPNLPANATPTYLSGGLPSNITVNENAQIKAAPGVFYGLAVNTVGTTSTAKLYDGVSAEALLPVASPGIVTVAQPLADELVPGSAVQFTGGSLPTGLTANTPVFVSTVGFASGVFQVADTKAHALAGTNSINFTGSESGVHTGWDVSRPLGTFDTTVLGPVPYPAMGAQLINGLIAITAGGAAADQTILYR